MSETSEVQVEPSARRVEARRLVDALLRSQGRVIYGDAKTIRITKQEDPWEERDALLAFCEPAPPVLNSESVAALENAAKTYRKLSSGIHVDLREVPREEHAATARTLYGILCGPAIYDHEPPRPAEATVGVDWAGPEGSKSEVTILERNTPASSADICELLDAVQLAALGVRESSQRYEADKSGTAYRARDLAKEDLKSARQAVVSSHSGPPSGDIPLGCFWERSHIVIPGGASLRFVEMVVRLLWGHVEKQQQGEFAEMEWMNFKHFRDEVMPKRAEPRAA